MLRYHHYDFKYLDPERPVHVLVGKAAAKLPLPRHKLPLYTVPWEGAGGAEGAIGRVNALVGFESPELIWGYAKDAHIEGDLECAALKEWKDVSIMLNLPLVVVMNEFCHLPEKTHEAHLYYFYKGSGGDDDRVTAADVKKAKKKMGWSGWL